jgi:hypothetical protein
LLFGLAGGVFSSNHESPQSYRTLTVVPAIALLAGDVLARLARGSIALVPAISDPKRLARYRTLATGLGGLLLVGSLSASAAWESSTYFGRQAKSIAVQAGFNLTENQIAQEVLKALDSDTPVYLSPRFYDFSPLRFLVYGAVKYKTGRNTLDDRPWHLARPEQDLPAPDVGRDAIFLLDTYYQPVMDYFRSFYPQAQIETVRWRDEIPLYLRVRVPHSELAALQGLEARFVGADGKLIERVASQIDEDWSQQAVASAEWSGNLKLEHSGMYDFTPQSQSPSGRGPPELDHAERDRGDYSCPSAFPCPGARTGPDRLLLCRRKVAGRTALSHTHPLLLAGLAGSRACPRSL